ncbi:hypothetical protein C0993_010463 [Termitomyces sp. T159_Od127]|nr:hypothetical protein C0993_010463 [Termitomyces sp. T159_Od127]
MSTNQSLEVLPAKLVKESDRETSVEGPLPVMEPSTPALSSSTCRQEPVVSRRELWSYYLYYNGDNGVGPMNYAMTLFQSLAFAAGHDPTKGPGSSCNPANASGQCVLPWAGGTKTVSSVVLVANGVSFAVMTLIFTTIGSAADYGTFGRWLLFVVTVICWAAQYSTMSLTEPSRWGVAMALYMIGFITYGATLVFYAAAFPRLARNTARARELREKYESGEMSREEYELEECLEKNHISNISTTHSNIGYIGTLCINLSVLIPLKSNPKSDNYALLLYAILGEGDSAKIDPNSTERILIGSCLVYGGIWLAIKQYKKLPYTFIYLFAFFLLADGLNTTTSLVGICQNDKFSFSFLQNTYLGLAQATTSTMATLGYWYIQKYWKLRTKTMVSFFTVHYLDPRFSSVLVRCDKCRDRFDSSVGYDWYLDDKVWFFGLFGLSNRASSMIGPNVIQAIIDSTGDNWMGFPFLFALCACASLVIWFGVDVAKGRNDAVAWAQKVRAGGEHPLWADEGFARKAL